MPREQCGRPPFSLRTEWRRALLSPRGKVLENDGERVQEARHAARIDLGVARRPSN